MKRYRKDFSKRSLAVFLKRSLAFIPMVFSFWLLMNIDQWMLSYMLGLDSVSLYGLAGKFSLLFDFLISSSFILVYTPFIYKKLQQNRREAIQLNIGISIFTIILGLTLFYPVAKCASFLGLLIDAKFLESTHYVAPLLLATIFRFAAGMLQLILRYDNKAMFILYTTIITVISNALLNYFLIPIFGINGCLFATILSFALMYILLALKVWTLSGAKDSRELSR